MICIPKIITYQAQRANEMMQNGDHSEAIKLFNNILKKNPHNYGSITSRGHAEKTLGRTDDAILSYKKAYAIKPDHGEAFFSLSNLKTYRFDTNELELMKDQLKRVEFIFEGESIFSFCSSARC